MKKKVKWVLIAALVGGLGFGYYLFRARKAEEQRPSYDRAQTELRDLRITVESTGEIQPRNRLDVKPPIAGRLEELLIDEGDLVEKGQILGWISSTERATLLDAALAKGREELEHWQALYKPSPLISPLNGTIIARNFEPGQSIESKDAVVVIADDLIVVASLDETDVGQVRIGQRVIVRLEAYPDTAFPCTVEKIAYDARTVSSVTMYDVDVRPEQLPSFARSGMTANLEFIIEEKMGVLAVPAAAIQQGSVKPRASGSDGDKGKKDDASRERMVARMRENGMTETEIKEQLARFRQGGKKRDEGRSKGGGRKGRNAGNHVLADSGDPENPVKKNVRIGISDGSYTEILEGLDEGEEVLIRKIRMTAKRTTGNSPFVSSRRGGGGGGRGGRRR